MAQVNGAEDDGVPEKKDVASRSSLITGQRRRYVTDITDPRHSEDAKYAGSGHDREKRMRNIIDREKQMIISSRDLHESFVEPLELVDDSDKDIRVRLGRSLKSVDTGVAAYVGSMAANGSGQSGIRPIENTSSTRSGLALASPFDLENLFKGDGRVKRQAASLPYDAYYDEMNQRGASPDSETMYYNRYMKSEENDHFQPLNPYETRDKVSGLELGRKSGDADDYNRISRNKDPAKKKKHNAKKKNNGNKNNNNNNNSNNKLKKKRKKVRKNKPKKMRRKRRHHKKQPKIKEQHEKKRKKSMKNHRNIKKGKGIDRSEDDKFHDQRKRHHGKGRKNVRI